MGVMDAEQVEAKFGPGYRVTDLTFKMGIDAFHPTRPRGSSWTGTTSSRACTSAGWPAARGKPSSGCEGKKARPARLERATHSLEGCCSIQLSYGRVSG